MLTRKGTRVPFWKSPMTAVAVLMIGVAGYVVAATVSGEPTSVLEATIIDTKFGSMEVRARGPETYEPGSTNVIWIGDFNNFAPGRVVVPQ